jgi:hypothetical protein
MSQWWIDAVVVLFVLLLVLRGRRRWSVRRSPRPSRGRSGRGRYTRPRVQAAWARHLHDGGVRYEAEPSWYGPDLGAGVFYRVDFWLPERRQFLAVTAGPDQVDAAALGRAQLLADKTGCDVQVVAGWPPATWWAHPRRAAASA